MNPRTTKPAKRTASVQTAKVAFTIVSKNYLHFARTLMESVRAHHPDWQRLVLLVDENRGELDLRKEPFETIEIGDLPLPDPRKFYFRYTILELNTAVKPWMFEWLFRQRHADQVVYLDPDISLYGPLAEVETALSSGAAMVLTPHLTGPLDDAHRPHEIDILQAGAYNLGFLALRRDPQTDRFLSWWQAKLEFNCVVDHARGLFVDQKWLDLAPGMFDHVAILRHEGYNVAYWNLAHRHFEKADGQYLVNGVPLVFYHFSGLDGEAPEKLSKYQNRFRLDQLRLVEELVHDYLARVRAHGSETTSRLPYAFGRFASGERIPDCIRQLYRQDEAFRRAAGEDPFVLASEYLNQPVGPGNSKHVPITILMQHIWSIRPDLQQAFPRIFGDDRRRFAEWFVANAVQEIGVPGPCVAPVASRLAGESESARHTPPGAGPVSIPSRPSIGGLMALDDAEFVMEAYRALLGRPADQSGLNHFVRFLHAGGTKPDVLWRLRYSREGRDARAPARGLWLSYVGDRLRRLVVGRRAPRIVEHTVPAAHSMPTIVAGGGSLISPHPLEAASSNWSKTARDRFGRSNYIGFYDWGDQHDGLVWMGRSASVRLPNAAPRTVQVKGSYDASHQRKANSAGETVFDVELNGTSVSQFVLSSSGAFEVSIQIPAIDLEQPAFLTLTASQVFVPAVIGLNADPRELSLRVARIAVDGAPLLDFSRIQSPYGVDAKPGNEIGINIVGYLRSEHGIGESARLCAQSAAAASVPFTLCDFNAGNSARTEDARWESRLGASNPYPVNVFHVNADQMTLARETLRERFFHDRYNIGYWHWELPDFPDRFQSGFAFLDEIWVPTSFVMDAVSSKSPIPVVKIPHSIAFEVDTAVERSKFGLPDGKFLFLAMYDMHSAQGRKNPQAVVSAFRSAFRDRDDVALVIKVQNTGSYPDEFLQLREELGNSTSFVVIDRTFTRNEVYELEMLCDSFVSLHRSEGFGLGLAESMYLGKPVIGTNWSGNVDFMNARNSCPVDFELITLDRDFGPYYKKGNTWADPDVEHAAWYMAKLVEDAPWRKYIALEGMKTIRSDFSPQRVGGMYRDRLRRIEI